MLISESFWCSPNYKDLGCGKVRSCQRDKKKKMYQQDLALVMHDMGRNESSICTCDTIIMTRLLIIRKEVKGRLNNIGMLYYIALPESCS